MQVSDQYFTSRYTVLPAESDSDAMLCLRSYQGLKIDISLCINPMY